MIGSPVTRGRSRVLQRLTPLAQIWHEKISGKTEVLEINYLPNVIGESDSPQKVQQAFWNKIEQRRIAEIQLGTTVVGPHRDDLSFSINQTPAKSYGS